MNLLAVDLGGTAIKYGLFEHGVLRDPHSFPTPLTYQDMKSSLLKIFNTFCELIPLSGMAMSVPGAVDSKSGNHLRS